MLEVVVPHQRPDPEGGGRGGRGGQGGHGRQLVAEVVRQEEGGEAQVLDFAGQGRPGCAVDSGGHLDAEAEGVGHDG
jgi:hypothetical protein